MDPLYDLAKMYDAYSDIVGKEIGNDPILLPVFHVQRMMQFEVTLGNHGEFLSACRLEKDKDAVTICPVTEEFVSASNNYVSPVLFGFLSALSPDFYEYCPCDKEEKQERYELFMTGLKAWCDSAHTNPIIQIIYQYLEYGTLIQDLVASRVLEQTNSGGLKCKGVSKFSKAFVRFRVCYDDSKPDNVWMDPLLHQSWIDYYWSILLQTRTPDVCYVTGERTICARTFGHGVRNDSDRAKLISFNDTKGLTYLGRFTDASQAYSIGYVTAEKAFSMLRYLIRKQAYVFYNKDKTCGRTFLIWSNHNVKLPNIFSDSLNAYSGILNFDDFGFDKLGQTENVNPSDTGKDMANRLLKAAHGYIAKIDPDEEYHVMILDSMSGTKGRLAICYYDSFGGRRLIHNILFWQDNCISYRWGDVRNREKKKKRVLDWFQPDVRDIVKAAYGIVKTDEDTGHCYLNVSDSDMRLGLSDIHQCIINRQAIPDEMILGVLDNVSRPGGMEYRFWENDLVQICYAMQRFNYVLGGKDMSKFLDDNTANRDVLFGRVMATMEWAQSRAFVHRDQMKRAQKGTANDSGSGSNDPDAIKKKNDDYVYHKTELIKRFEDFVMAPATTMSEVQECLIPYFDDLKKYELDRYNEFLDYLVVKLDEINGFTDKELGSSYLTGYVEQRSLLKAISKDCIEKYKEKHKADANAGMSDDNLDPDPALQQFVKDDMDENQEEE